MKRKIWYLKQLFPFLYYSKYKKENKYYFHIWRMWFGRCFNEIKFEIKGE